MGVEIEVITPGDGKAEVLQYCMTLGYRTRVRVRVGRSLVMVVRDENSLMTYLRHRIYLCKGHQEISPVYIHA